MSKFSAIAGLKPTEKEEKGCSPMQKADYWEISINQHEALRQVLSVLGMEHFRNEISMEMAAINQLNKNNDYRGIIDILSHGNLETFHKRLGISNEDLFNRSQSGIRDVYVSSLTEDVTNFIGNLWEAVRSAIQKVYDWSNNLISDNSKIGLCKQQLQTTVSAVQAKGKVGITVDMTDPNDWKEKAVEVLKLYQVLEEILSSAAQSIVAGQLTENSLQDQLLGKMQRANIQSIKLNIQDGAKSSSFQFPGIGSGRIEMSDVGAAITDLNDVFMNQMLPRIDSLNKAVASYAQNITTAQTQYKCNTDCAAVVSNISSATQMITKSIVSVNSFVSEVIANGLLDILGKVTTTIGSMQDAPAPQEPQQPPQKITPMEPQQAEQPTTGQEQPAQGDNQ